MFLSRNLLRRQVNRNKIYYLNQYPEARCFCDKKDSDVTVSAKVKKSSLVREVKSEVAKIHATYKSEVLVNLETGEEKKVSLSPEEEEKALSDKYIVKFESRLDHFRKSGYIFDPVEINAPDEPSVNPIVDKAIDIIKGTGDPRDLAPAKIFTENSDNRSLDYYPPTNDRTEQKWHHDTPEETTLGFPVIRPPHPWERIKEGFRWTKSGPEKYPWIQEFKDQYDIVIVGGGIVGSLIAYYLTERVEVKRGLKVAVIEKDPTYRRSASTLSPYGLRVQHSLPETIEMALYGSDFLRHIGRNLAIPFDEIQDEDYFNIPNIKFQPHGHLTLGNHEKMPEIIAAHEMQRMCGVQSAILTAKQIQRRFPWLNTHGIEGGCLGLESEGWYDTWNLLQAVKLKNKHQGVDYIDGEVIYFKKHKVVSMTSSQLYMGFQYDGSKVPIGRNFEAHLLLPDSQQVYPLHFSNCILAAGGETGDLGRMCGIGDGYGPLRVEIPVERRRGYLYTVDTHQAGPGLNCPLTSDPSGLFIRREGHAGQFIVGHVPDGSDVPLNIHGDVHPDYWQEKIFPVLKDRFEGFDNATVLDSQPIDYDHNYFDGSPIIGPHPYMGNMWLACGFGGYGGCLAPAAARGLMELIIDDGYTSIDLSRFAFDRILLGKAVEEKSGHMFTKQIQASN